MQTRVVFSKPGFIPGLHALLETYPVHYMTGTKRKHRILFKSKNKPIKIIFKK